MRRAEHQAFEDPRVEAVFDAYPEATRARLMALRQVIFDTAATTEGVGTLQETLKWSQPSYLTAETKSGSTIRIDRAGKAAHPLALYVHCRTNLVPTFKELYPGTFGYEGNRAILLDEDREIVGPALRHCIALALTYHLRKRSRAGLTAGVA